MARSLISQRSNIIAVVIGDLINPFHALATQQIVERLRDMKLVPIVFQIGQDAATKEYWQAIEEYQVAAILITALNVTEDVQSAIRGLDTPCILFNRSLAEVDLPSVAPDLRQGGHLAATHLVKSGCRRIAIVGGLAGTATAEQRMNGFLSGLEQAGLEPFKIVSGNYRYEGGAKAADEIFSADTWPDGILCANDLLAFGLIDQARKAYHARIPEDVLIVGFDGTPNSAWGAYDLTTIELPLDSMLTSVARMVDNIVNDKPTGETEEAFACRLIPRSSSRRSTNR
nr:substrate-binding domain-containing protein [Hoeflea prorocentri]